MAASAACQQRQLGTSVGRQAATAPLLPPRRHSQRRRGAPAVRAVADPNELLQLASSTAGSLQTVAADLAAVLPAGVAEPVVAAASTLATGGRAGAGQWFAYCVAWRYCFVGSRRLAGCQLCSLPDVPMHQAGLLQRLLRRSLPASEQQCSARACRPCLPLRCTCAALGCTCFVAPCRTAPLRQFQFSHA